MLELCVMTMGGQKSYAILSSSFLSVEKRNPPERIQTEEQVQQIN